MLGFFFALNRQNKLKKAIKLLIKAKAITALANFNSKQRWQPQQATNFVKNVQGGTFEYSHRQFFIRCF